ncbi:MAG: molybdopterin-dependent oxidoreductase [Pseudomonadota bacterium]
MTETCTTCPYCGVGCGVLAAPDGSVRGDPDHPANFGRLCSKGAALGETIDLEGRLLHPVQDGQRVDWDTALDCVAREFSQAVAEHGPDSVAFYVSGQLLTEDYYVANKLMKGYIGSANIDTNSRLCMASSVAGHKRAFGTDTVPGTYEDLEEAELLVLVGSNLAWCHPVLWQRVQAARARTGMKVVVIDPRRTVTADEADLHLAIQPDEDVAVFGRLLAYLYEVGAVDADFVAAHVDGFDTALDAASGLPEPSVDLRAFFALWARTEKVVTVYSQGVNQSTCGTDKVGAIINCHLSTGRIGKPGMGPFSVTGQPNAMGGREVGGLANMLANHLDIENAAHRTALQDFWNSPVMCTAQGLKAVDLFDACAEGRIKALWVMSTNPAVSLPDAGRVAEAIANVPFTVVSDIMARTDTGDLADVLLPAAGWGEKSGTVTNSERRISRQRAFLPVPGEARPDWQIICDVAARMGFGDGFAFRSPAEVFDEYAASTALSQRFGKDLDLTGLSGLTAAAYDGLAPVQWPVPADDAAGGRFFASGGFYHEWGRARMLPVTSPERSAPRFTLNTGRIRDQWHTMTRTGKSPRLGAHLAEPFVEIHPLDAKEIGLEAATLLELRAGRACGLFRAWITDRVQRGQLFVPMHWTRQTGAGSLSNITVKVGTDPYSGQPALKSGAVDAVPYGAAWYGFAASLTRPNISAPYCALARTVSGWQVELAGHEAPEDWDALLMQLGGAGEISRYLDVSTGQVRLALSRGGNLVAVFFAAPEPVRVARQTVIDLIGTDAPPLRALAGRPAEGAPDAGPIVCSCMAVGRNQILGAIDAGARTLDAVGTSCGAGTSCGSCRAEISGLLSAVPEQVAAE